MSDSILRQTNSFPNLLLVTLTLCNVIALVPSTMMGLFVLAAGVAYWSHPTSELASATMLYVSIPLLHIGGPLLAWFNRSWPSAAKVVCLLLPLAYLGLVARTAFAL